jgi:predicted DNA binding CopG/RHH family protein
MKRNCPTMKIDADEKELLESVERGEWKSAGGGERARVRFSRYAKATFKKDRRLNIRLSIIRPSASELTLLRRKTQPH